MSFDPIQPVPAQSPAVFPPANQTNMQRLQALFSADHQFNLSAAANDGWHKIIRWVSQAGSYGDGTPPTNPSTPLFYTKNIPFIDNNAIVNYNIPLVKSTNGIEFPILPTVRAYVNFQGSNVNGAQVIRQSFNVQSVERIEEGVYRVNFGQALTNNRYVTIATGMALGNKGRINGFVDGNTNYGNIVKTDSVTVAFTGSSDNFRDVRAGNVIVFGIA